MAGIYGNDPEDRYFEKKLDDYLDSLDVEECTSCRADKKSGELTWCEECDDYLCEECEKEGCSCVDQAEAAHEAFVESFYGGSEPVTIKEKQEKALKEKEGK